MNWGLVRRVLAAFILFMVVAGAARAEVPMTADEFARSYAARVEKRFPGSKVVIKGALEVEISMRPESGAKSLKSYLDNAFKTYLDEPANLDEIMNQYIQVLAGDFDVKPFAKREQLVAVVRHRNFMEEVQKAKRPDQFFPERQIAGDIHVFYAFDAPDTVRYADMQTIEKLGLKEADLEVVSIENLRRIMVEPLLETYPEMVAISSNDPYMASVLLFDQFWSPDRFRFRGDLVAFVLSRDLMLVTGSEESAGLAAAQKAAKELIEKLPYAISAEPIVRRDGKWEVFVQ